MRNAMSVTSEAAKGSKMRIKVGNTVLKSEVSKPQAEEYLDGLSDAAARLVKIQGKDPNSGKWINQSVRWTDRGAVVAECA